MEREAAARLLGIGVDADDDEVERAFRVRARATHPDLGGDAAVFRGLLEARRTLRPPRGRSDVGSRTRLEVVQTPANPVMRVLQALRNRLLPDDTSDRVR